MLIGASLSSDIYKYKVDSHLEVIEQCVVITDDIIIYGYDIDGTDHYKMVREVMRKLKRWVCTLTHQNASSERLRSNSLV